jgi:hypothetical protein
MNCCEYGPWTPKINTLIRQGSFLTKASLNNNKLDKKSHIKRTP